MSHSEYTRVSHSEYSRVSPSEYTRVSHSEYTCVSLSEYMCVSLSKYTHVSHSSKVRQTQRTRKNVDVDVDSGAFPPRVTSHVDFRAFYATCRCTNSKLYVSCFRSHLEKKNESTGKKFCRHHIIQVLRIMLVPKM